MEVDPDYNFDVLQDSLENESKNHFLEENAREAVKEKIKSIITKQFSEEIAAKEREVTLITERLAEARHLLDRLRACVVASYYASSFAKPHEKHSVEPGAAYHPAIQNVLRKAATAVLSRNTPVERKTLEVVKDSDDQFVDTLSVDSKETESKEIEGISKINESDLDESNMGKPHQETTKHFSAKENLGGRHRIKKTIIVGNVSKYIAPDKREGNDKSSHKWMVYVRGSADDPRIDHFVRKVWFFLHPSYRPNDLVEVTEAPFHLTRRGWGEFPIRVQLHFCDPRNRRVDIIHNLRLDRTYTGLQTLGAETVCKVELDRSTIGLPVENLLMQSVAPPINDSSTTSESIPNSDQNETSQVCSTENKTLSSSLRKEVKSALEDLLEKVKEEEELSENKMEVDLEEVEEENNTSSSSTTEKRRRRRKGDSCCIVEKEEKPKSMAMMLLCPDEDLDDVIELNLNENKCEDASKDDENATIESTENLKASAVTVVEKTEIADLVEKPREEDNSGGHLPLRKTQSRSPPRSPDFQKSSHTQSERPRSLSVDSVSSSSMSVSLGGGKFLHVRKVTNVKDGISNPGKSGGISSSPSVVLLRPRASSTGLAPQNLKGKVTILTPIGAKSTKSPSISGQKRTLSRSSTPPSGNVFLNIPQKKQKLSPNVTSSAPTISLKSVIKTPLAGKIMINASEGKQQIDKVSPPKDFAIRGSNFTASTTSSSKPLSENVAKNDCVKPTKSFILKNTKQGLMVVGQSIVVKDSFSAIGSSQKAVQSKSKAFAAKASTHENSHTTEDEKQKSSSSEAEHSSPKQISPQHLVALKALKNVLASSGIASNKPVHIKIEKGGSQSFNQLKNNQQFILTTVTNDQGKQQLVLVSADRMKQAMENKQSGKSHLAAQDISPVLDDTPFIIKLDSDPTDLPFSKLNGQENLPYYQLIGNKILNLPCLTNLKNHVLPAVVKYVPLVAKNFNIVHLPFCAKTEADFLEWNIGKQRAAEMQRALLIQKILKYVCENSSELAQADIPSKRYITKWCLLRGYSIFTDEYEDADNVDVESTTESSVKKSISGHCELIEKLEEDSVTIANARDEESCDVDILSVTPPRKSVKSEPLDPYSEHKKCRFIHTDEMRAVDRMVQEIGLTLRDVPISDVVNAPLTQVVLAKALELFISQLSRESLASALIRRDGNARIQRVQPEEITCADVADAVLRNENTLILSDCYMGTTSGL